MKFKIGDKVIGNEKANRYGITKKGWVGTVIRISAFANAIDACGEDGRIFKHLFSDAFDLFEEPINQKIVITTDGKTTLARLYEGKKVVKSAEAKCSSEDKFDFKTGAEIAFDRLLEKEVKPETPEKPKPYNGKVVCVNPRQNSFYTKGKIYQIINGVLHSDDGDIIFGFNPLRSFKDLCHSSTAEWLEIVE